MKKVYSKKKNDVNLITILFDLWQKKFLLFKIVIVISLLNSPYFFLKKYNITLNDNFFYINNTLKKFYFSKTEEKNLSIKFNDILYNNLKSRKVLNDFLKQKKNPRYYDFFIYKIDANVKKRFNNDVIFLLFYDFDGLVFLNNYLDFIINKSAVEFNYELKLLIKEIILKYEAALDIATKINLENPIIKEKQLDKDDLEVSNDYFLYYEGIKILNYRINQYKFSLEEINNNSLNYYIKDKDLIISKINIFENFLYFFYLMFRIILISFFLYLLIIFYKNFKNNKLIKNVKSF